MIMEMEFILRYKQQKISVYVTQQNKVERRYHPVGNMLED